ncbi:dynein axonemal assembly factor 11-like [Sceloporus undulatus]|uniref:dynein axonemal assembly factor 11-like n=1 Tax=Sceloporus undulatus TaxID=8520 RepID=UPI001C4B84A2|nr:dynein axonemal assembly factor 11-like [Sceloporus undulatus]
MIVFPFLLIGLLFLKQTSYVLPVYLVHLCCSLIPVLGLKVTHKIIKKNHHLRELFLTGNPCTDFEGYRQFVVSTLHQLRVLDGREIERSERIQAIQNYAKVEKQIQKQEQAYLLKRREEKEEAERRMQEKEKQKKRNLGFNGRWYTDINATNCYSVEGTKSHQKAGEKNEYHELLMEDDDEEERVFWEEPVPHTPEARLEAHRYVEEKRKAKENREQLKKEKPPRTMITLEGRVLNVNDPKLPFSLKDDEENNQFILDLAVYRHLDTSLLDVDVQPGYVRVMVKGKPFQLVLPGEVKPDSSIARRSQTTGHLVISLPKAKEIIVANPKTTTCKKLSHIDEQKRNLRRNKCAEKLEVDPNKYSFPDVTNIVRETDLIGQGPLRLQRQNILNTNNAFPDFDDDPDVPPLI